MPQHTRLTEDAQRCAEVTRLDTSRGAAGRRRSRAPAFGRPARERERRRRSPRAASPRRTSAYPRRNSASRSFVSSVNSAVSNSCNTLRSREVVVYTIGHSTRSTDELIAILADAGVTRVADVRAFPMSRRHPQFNKDALSVSLPAPGGRRGARKDGRSRNGLWKVDAFRNYADYAETAAFGRAIGELEALARERPTAVMCAEAVWWQCHRRLITDYMLARGWDVVHLLAPGQQQPGVLTPGAVPHDDGTIEYPPPQPDLLPGSV